MISREQIKANLQKIAENYGYSGESTEMIIDMLTYLSYHNQIEILNATQESSLSTAKLINSKIVQCMSVMYSVYRGKNAKVKLHFRNNTLIKKNRLDLIYESNSFKLYTDSVLSLEPSTIGSDGKEILYTIECIFAKDTKFVTEVEVTEQNKFFIDAIVDKRVLGNLSEDVKVTIDDVEYPTTRNFYEHINQPIYNPLEEISETNQLDKLFILTIPDYGIRVFKKGYIDSNGNTKGYFETNKTVKIECLTYTTAEEINVDEFNKIIVPGTILIPFSGYREDGKTPIVEGDTGRELLNEIPRETSNSILYNANSSTRTQSQILSNSDVNVLFSEYFIDVIQSAINWYNKDTDTLYIYYVPKVVGNTITQLRVNSFVDKYKSYFITQNIAPVKGIQLSVYVNLEIYITDTNEINDAVQAIFDKYANRLNPIGEDTLINTKAIYAEISRLSTVSYINKYTYTRFLSEDKTIDQYNTTESNDFPIPTEINGVPVYYKFEVTINYKNSYEVIS